MTEESQPELKPLTDDELRDVVILDDGTDEPIRVRDIEHPLVSIDRIRQVVDRVGTDDLLRKLTAQAIVMGMEAPMLLYAETGDEATLREAVQIRSSLDAEDSVPPPKERKPTPKERKRRHAEVRLRTLHARKTPIEDMRRDLEETTGWALTIAEVWQVLTGRGWPVDRNITKAIKLFEESDLSVEEIEMETGVTGTEIMEAYNIDTKTDATS